LGGFSFYERHRGESEGKEDGRWEIGEKKSGELGARSEEMGKRKGDRR
jgi:hypothetical protein